jgi:HPt (histidine-containing phosphotransfer) domain-containing protein
MYDGDAMAESVVDREAILVLLNNDTELLKEIVELFLTDYPGMMEAIRTAVAARDPVRLEKAAHILKGSIGNFGAARAVEVAQELETMGRQKVLDGVTEAHSRLEQEVLLVSTSLEKIKKEAA